MNENYEKFRHQLMMKLMDNGVGDVEKILKLTDIVSKDYKIELVETLPAIYEGGVPEEFKEYLVEKKLQGYSQDLLKNELYVFTNFFKQVGNNIQTINANSIRAFLYSYQVERGISNRSLDKYRSWFSSFFRWCADNGYISSNPMRMIKPIKYDFKKRDALSSTQWEQFRNIPNTLKGKVIVEFLYSTGCRVNELCNVKVGDIDLPNREVKVLGKGNKERMVYLNDKIYLLLKEYLADKSPEDYLLNAPNDPSTRISNNAIRKRFDKWCEQCPDIPFGVTPHIIRHTMATTLLDRGVPIEQISALLGHSQLETTMIYINLNTNQIKESHRKYII